MIPQRPGRLGSLLVSLRSTLAGQKPLSEEEMEAQQREKVLEAALRLFAERGYRAVSVEELAASAEMDLVSFQRLFEGKEACFLALLQRLYGEARRQIAAAVAPEAPWPEQLRAGLRALVELIEADPAGARVALDEAQLANPAAASFYQAAISDLAAFLRRGRALHPHGEELPELLELALAGGTAWLLRGYLAAGSDQLRRDHDLPDQIASWILPIYLGEAGPCGQAAPY